MIEVKITGESWAEVAGQIAGIAGGALNVTAASEAVPAPEAPAEGKPEAKPAAAEQADENRPYGSTGEGRKRRTKDEMAEDQEIYELSERLGLQKIPTDTPAKDLLADLRERVASAGDAAEEEPEALTGEVVDDDGEEFTRETVREALAAFAEKHGMAKAQTDGPKLMGAARLSAIPDDAEAFKKATLALREAL